MALTTNVSATMAVYYSKVFLEKARLLIRHDAFAQKRAVPANNGKVVSFTRHAQPASNTATTAVTEAVTPSSLLVSGITVTASLTEYGAYTMVSKFYERMSVDVGLKEQIESMGVHMGLVILAHVKSFLNTLENLRDRCILSTRLLTPILWQSEASNQLLPI